MSLFEFEKGDIIRNTIVSYPKNKFLFYKGDVIYNDSVQELDSNWDGGADETLSKYIPSGHISLYELNIDRESGADDSNLIRPFVKGGSGWKPTTSVEPSELPEPDADGNIYGYYPLSSSISCDYVDKNGNEFVDNAGKLKAHALENTVNYYRYLSSRFNSEELFHGDDFNIISIPSIFYGNKINPGSVRLELIVTGSQDSSIVLSDNKKNGELLQSNGAFHGVVLYNEGFLILKSTAQISTHDTGLASDANISPRWIDFGMHMNDRTKLAWSIEFEGVTETPVMTMFAHARKNELNHSNNPSFLKQYTDPDNENSLTRLPVTSSNSHVYREEDSKEIRNVTKTDLLEEDPIFEKETYISKIAIYDDQKKVIGYARLARPIRKTEEREMTFKLKIDL